MFYWRVKAEIKYPDINKVVIPELIVSLVTAEDANEAIPLVDIAYIYSKLWIIKGGLMYRITKGSPRYAFRQFQADGILTAKNEPSDIVSGAKALSIFTSCINKYSGFDMKAVSMEID